MSVLLVVLVVVGVVVLASGTVAGAAVSRRRRQARLAAAARGHAGAGAGTAARAKPLEGEGRSEPAAPPGAVAERAESLPPPPTAVEEPTFRGRMGKARQLVSGYLGSVRRKATIDEETWEELEEALVRADVGVATTAELLEPLRERVRKGEIRSPEGLLDSLKSEITELLDGAERRLHLSEDGRLSVWLFVGVNGVGKTTTIGKVARREVSEGHRVVMAAADTFRAAAADQLELWGKRVGSDVVRGAEGGDPGAVVFDAVQRAAARDADIVLADTAGRLHTKVNLMEELAKVRRVADRPPGSVCEVLLVIDATTGQNGLAQARQFTESVGVTGVVLTKLDGTARGGIVVAIVRELGIPVKLVGLGESPNDLVEMDPGEFVEALLGN